MKSMFAKNSKGGNEKPAKFIAPGRLAKVRAYGQIPPMLMGEYNAAQRNTNKTQKQVEEQETQYVNNHTRTGGISAHTLIVYFGEDQWTEKDFTEDSSFLDILNICKKFIDIYSVGFKVTDGNGKPLRNDKDVLSMLKEHEDVENIDIYVDLDENAEPLFFKMPQDNPTFAARQRVPKVRDATILGDYKANKKIQVRGDVINGTEKASTVQFFITISKTLDMETGLQAISECTINKEFQIPIEAVGHYLVAKFTPMTEDGESGEPRYVLTDKCIEDSTPQKERKVRGKNKNRKIAVLKSGEKLQIEFFNNRAVGEHHKSWSRHLGKIVRNKHICPIRVKSWRELTELDKQHMWDSVKECFSHPNIEFYRESTLEHMGTLWAAWRSSLNVDYVRPCITKTEVLKNVPEGMNAKDWEWLVTNKFLTDEFRKTSIQNANNRVNGVMPHRTGSKPHRQLIYEMGGKDGNPPDIAKIFYETRQKKGKFVEPEIQEKYDEIVNIVQSNASLSQIEVVEKCFGPQRHSHVFGFGGGMKRKHFNDSQTAYIKELEAKLHDKEEENNHLKRRMDTIESRLARIENDNQPTSDARTTCDNGLEQVDSQRRIQE